MAALLQDLAHCTGIAQVLITQNLPEPPIACPDSLTTRVRTICNTHPQGFAANHNQAFKHCNTALFAVLNPDIHIQSDPFPTLAHTLANNKTGMVAPAVYHPNGTAEDSARHFPTLRQLFGKLLGLGDGRIHFNTQIPVAVDWTAGMFMLFKADTYRALGGFDEGFFLYYEDVDICVRLWKSGHAVVLHPGVHVIHAAQRASRRNLRYLKWHAASMLRYFRLHLGRLPHTEQP